MKALVYGAVNPDLVHQIERLPRRGDDVRSRDWLLTWGGKASNAAMALATWDVETRLLGLVIGHDPLGDALLASLDHPGIDTSWIERDPAERTRHCIVLVTPDGDRTIVCAGYDDARWSPVPEAAWHDIEVVLVDGFGGAAAADVISDATSRGIPTVWLDAPDPLPASPSLVVWSRHEHGDDAARALAAGGVGVALTSGARPVAVWAGTDRFDVAPPEVHVVDTTGAGDVFAAACARGLAGGQTLRRVVTWAAAAAALAATEPHRSTPARAEIDALVRSRHDV
jgi:ribokinase